MENNTVNINVATGEITHSYTEPIVYNQPIFIDYDEEVERLIRERYTASQEFAIQRKRDVNTEEFQEYFDFCESCKLQVREMYNL